MQNVALYCRVSTDEQAKFGISIDAQVNALKKYCVDKKYTYELFIDNGISASSMKRPALQNMLGRIDEFSMVLFTKLDRLSRNVLDANNINKILIDNKVFMKAIDEDDIDTSTADGTFMFNLRVSLAQREIGKTSERIRYVFDYKRTKGEVVSGATKYGYSIVDKKFVINPDEQQNLINLYKYLISVGGDTQLCFDYFKSHFPNTSYNCYYTYLHDTAYIGKYKLYLKDEYIDGYIPALMDIELFNSVQSLLKKRRRRPKNNLEIPITLFDGLIKCSNCGGTYSRSVSYDKNNKAHLNYRCWRSTGKSKYLNEIYRCNNKRVIVENKIEKQLLNMLKNEINKYIIKTTEITIQKNKYDNIDDDIKRLELKLNRLKDLYIDNFISKDTYKKDYEKYRKDLNDLKNVSYSSNKLEKKDFSVLQQILNSDFISLYNKLEKLEKRRFWVSILDGIVMDNGIVIELKFL